MRVTLDLAARVLAPLLRLLRVRIYKTNVNRIGDMNMELGGLAKRRAVGWDPPQRAIAIPYPDNWRTTNAVALAHLRRHVHVRSRDRLYPLLFRLYAQQGIGGDLNGQYRLPDGREVPHYVVSANAQVAWEAQGRGALLTLEPALEREGRAFLRRLGLGADDWYVALHAREGGFLHEETGSHHALKNVDVDTYLDAVAVVVDAGGWVIRVGDPSMKPLPPLDRVVDYAHHPDKSKALDVFLAAACRFWLGTNSGYLFVAHNFGRPVAVTNLLPITFRPWASVDRFVPKLYELDGRVLSFPEMLAPELFYARDVLRAGIRPIDNTPEELAAVARELLEVSAGAWTAQAEDDALQSAYDALVDDYPAGVLSRVGRDFLRTHRDLLAPVGAAAGG